MAKNGEKSAHSFGRYLQAIRIEKGVSLETVSEETKIRLETLIQIEEEDHAGLPNETFVKGFLRAYARAIGADGNEAVRRYQSRLGVIQKIAASDAGVKQTGRRFWTRLFLAIGGMACLIAAAIGGMTFFQGRHPAPPTAVEETPTAVAPNSPPADQPAPQQSPPPAEVSPQPTEKYLLRIETVEETWLKIIIDDQGAAEYSLYPGDHIELKASKGYNILLGNAGGIRMFLNNDPVAVTGKSGQVVNIQLP
jgi:cytoskeletal protein RodZ